MPSLSIIASFRDRDPARVARFLDSLAQQTEPDFELIFLDYGSRDEVSGKIRELCANFSFCRYIYNHTRGMYWNRAHAMNSAARFAQSPYLLFTDIDLIFSHHCVARLKQSLVPGKQFFCRAYLLPESFHDYSELDAQPTHFRLSSLKTKGLFHGLARPAFEQIGGFDEYFCIWGLEDMALALEAHHSGLETVWLESAEAPMYHQWHPSSSNLSNQFPQKWWEDMVLHHALRKDKRALHASGRGKLMTAQDRPSLTKTETTQITLASELEPPGRARALRDIVHFLQEYPGQVLSVRIRKPSRDAIVMHRQSKNRYLSAVINYANRLFRSIKLPVVLMHQRPLRIMHEYTFSAEQSKLTPETLQYALHRLIKDDGLVRDYAISRDAEGMTYKLVG